MEVEKGRRCVETGWTANDTILINGSLIGDWLNGAWSDANEVAEDEVIG